MPIPRSRSRPAPPRPRVEVHWEVRRRLLSDAALRRAAGAALAAGRRPSAWISIVLVADRTLAKLHGKWLGDPAPTDVIAFDLAQDPSGPEGEVYVSPERAVLAAAERGLDPRRELALYVVHGVLHLCGFDDRASARRARMRRAEATVLARLGYAGAERGRERRSPSRRRSSPRAEKRGAAS